MDSLKKPYGYKLLKNFPDMDIPIGTIFYERDGAGCWSNKKSTCTGWMEDTFFKPYIGEFWEKIPLNRIPRNLTLK